MAFINRHFTETDSKRLFEAIEHCRKAVIDAQSKAPFSTEIYEEINSLCHAVTKMGIVLTGDPDCFLPPVHSSPPRSVPEKVHRFKSWKAAPWPKRA